MKFLNKIFIVVAIVAGLWILYSAASDYAKQPLLQTQIQQYIDAADTAASVAYETNPTLIKEAMERFIKIQNGSMQVIGDDRVNWAMALFADCMKDLSNEKCKDRDLKTLSAALSKSMRASVAASARLRIDSTN